MTATRNIAAPATVTTFVLPNMLTDIERFEDCRAFNPFALVDIARKHGGGRKADLTVREKLVDLIKAMSPDGSPLVQADVLERAEREEIASTATLRGIMMECAEAAGIKVEIVRGRRGPRGPMGPRDATIVRERLIVEKLTEILESHPEGIKRDDLEKMLADDGFNAAAIRSASAHAKTIGLTIIDRAVGRQKDQHRIDVTREALKACAAAGLKSRTAIIGAVLRYWQIYSVECAHTESAAYSVILAVRKADADAQQTPEPENVAQPEPVAQSENVAQPAPF